MSWFTIIKDEPLQRSFELLQSILKENAGNLTILTEPYIDDGDIIGVVEVTGTSGNIYTIDFQKSCPTIHKEITIDPEIMMNYIKPIHLSSPLFLIKPSMCSCHLSTFNMFCQFIVQISPQIE